MSITRKAATMGFVGLMATMAVAAAPAGASPTAAEDIGPEGAVNGVWPIYRPGETSAPQADCRERTSSSGGWAHICSNFAIDPYDNTAYGYYAGTSDAGTSVRVKVDGGIYPITHHPHFKGVFGNVRSVTFQACKAGVCGGFS